MIASHRSQFTWHGRCHVANLPRRCFFILLVQLVDGGLDEHQRVPVLAEEVLPQVAMSLAKQSIPIQRRTACKAAGWL